ncbi:MAG: HYR domain-containing protein [Bacteroidota bacterium]|nr:HYR domain-containing protein [Bacteroidota bacterium]
MNDAAVSGFNLNFRLEIYQRNPSFDGDAPIFTSCPSSPIEVDAAEGESSAIVNYSTPTAEDNCSVTVTRIEGQASGSQFPVGTHDIVYQAEDASGNISTCEFQIIVNASESTDTEPPVITCPAISEQPNDAGKCAAVVTYDLPVVTDNSGETITPILESGPASGSEFLVGTTTVTYSAEDSAGNRATCSFDIVVNDEEKPAINCSAGAREITLAEGETYSIPDFESEIVFSDNCDSSLSYSQTPGEGTEINTTTDVNITVTDAAGNENSCSFTVTVIEESPELQITNCPGPQTFEVDENCAYLIPDIAAMIETNIPEAVITQNIEAGFEVHGDLTLTITATYEDQTDTCEVQLLAKDSIAPSITCPSDQSETISSGESFQLPNYVLQSDSSDNCTIASFQQVPEVGTQITETTEVTLTVTDEDGNATSCSFTVNIEVTNEETLQINCPQNYTLQADANCNYFVPDFSTIVTTNIDGAIIEQEQVAGTNFDPNSDPYIRVTATYEDQSDYCDIYLLPEDQIAPTAQCIQEYQVTLDEGETVEIDPLDLDGGSADNCGIASYALSQTQFSSADEGVQDIRFTVTDNFGNSDECTVAIRVVVNTAGNQAPLANPDMYETLMNTTLEVPAGQGILSNDSDPEGNDLNIVLVDQTSNGSLSLNDDGSFQYIPNEGFFGMDNFTYYINDGELDSETVEVSINVRPP